MTKEELKVLVEDLKVKAKEEYEANIQKVVDVLQAISKFPVRVYGQISESNYISLEVNFVKPNGEDDFGSDFHIYYYKEGYSTIHKGLEISTGTIGSYGEDAVYQIERVKVINFIWSNIEDMKAFFESLKCPISIVCREKAYELEEIEREERFEEMRRQRASIENQFEVGKKFHSKDYTNSRYEIVKITPKRVYYADYSEYYDRYINRNQFFDKHDLITKFLSERSPFVFDEEGEANDTTSV